MGLCLGNMSSQLGNPTLSPLTPRQPLACFPSLWIHLYSLELYKWDFRDLLGEGNGTPLQYFCLENPMDGGAWWAAVNGVTESQTRLSNFTFMHWRRKWQPNPAFLPGESQGRGSLVGCHLWGRTESDTTEVT